MQLQPALPDSATCRSRARHAPQVILAVMARRAVWRLHEPNETWRQFPIAVPSKGMVMDVARFVG
jgi:hypothetical protein